MTKYQLTDMLRTVEYTFYADSNQAAIVRVMLLIPGLDAIDAGSVLKIWKEPPGFWEYMNTGPLAMRTEKMRDAFLARHGQPTGD